MSERNSTAAYDALKSRFERLSALYGAQAVLHWDRATMMPEGGAGARAEQQAALSLIAHETLTAPEVAELLEAAHEADGLGEWDRANLSEMVRNIKEETKLNLDGRGRWPPHEPKNPRYRRCQNPF